MKTRGLSVKEPPWCTKACRSVSNPLMTTTRRQPRLKENTSPCCARSSANNFRLSGVLSTKRQPRKGKPRGPGGRSWLMRNFLMAYRADSRTAPNTSTEHVWQTRKDVDVVNRRGTHDRPRSSICRGVKITSPPPPPPPCTRLNHRPSTKITNQQLQSRDDGYFVSTA